MKSWLLLQVKARLSALIRKKVKPNFVDFLRNSPLIGVQLDLKRDNSSERDIDLT